MKNTNRKHFLNCFTITQYSIYVNSQDAVLTLERREIFPTYCINRKRLRSILTAFVFRAKIICNDQNFVKYKLEINLQLLQFLFLINMFGNSNKFNQNNTTCSLLCAFHGTRRANCNSKFR